ncbi:hypothetical protein DV737_g3220, partial [Chaetothyriales sp. CBS 132003]
MAELVVPGQAIGDVSTHLAGSGTHVHGQAICASIVGSVVTLPSAARGGKPTISIPRHSHLPSTALPTVGSTVLCRVIRVQQRQLIASILITDPTPATYVPFTTITNDELQFQAVLRREDIRGYDKDKIDMNDMFRTGDIIKAAVISLGDERSYYISTVGNEYGVVIAQSEAGNAMVPASWNSMMDAVSGQVESRKVAKPSS